MFDLKHLGSLNPIVQSIDWDYPHNKWAKCCTVHQELRVDELYACVCGGVCRLLVSTGGHEIFEVSDTDGSDLNGGPLVQAHHSYVGTFE